MRFIEVTSRDRRNRVIGCGELDGWLRRKARHAVVVCHYGDKASRSVRHEFIGGENTVPAERDGMELERVVL